MSPEKISLESLEAEMREAETALSDAYKEYSRANLQLEERQGQLYEKRRKIEVWNWINCLLKGDERSGWSANYLEGVGLLSYLVPGYYHAYGKKDDQAEEAQQGDMLVYRISPRRRFCWECSGLSGYPRGFREKLMECLKLRGVTRVLIRHPQPKHAVLKIVECYSPEGVYKPGKSTDHVCELPRIPGLLEWELYEPDESTPDP